MTLMLAVTHILRSLIGTRTAAKGCHCDLLFDGQGKFGPARPLAAVAWYTH